MWKTHKELKKIIIIRDNVDRLYVARKEGRGFASIEDSVDASIQRPDLENAYEDELQPSETIPTTRQKIEWQN